MPSGASHLFSNASTAARPSILASCHLSRSNSLDSPFGRQISRSSGKAETLPGPSAEGCSRRSGHHCWPRRCCGLIPSLGLQEDPRGDRTAPARARWRVAARGHITRLEEVLQDVSNEISLLYKFSNTIRKASRATQNQKAADGFRMLDIEGNGTEPLLRQIFSNYIRDRCSGVSEKMRDRLIHKEADLGEV